MKRQIYICLSTLLAFVSTIEINAKVGMVETHSKSSENGLLRKLPTALLENLQRDLQAQESQLNKRIDDIAGIPKARLEAEIKYREREDRSRTIGTRKINPKQLTGDLLKYIAEGGVSYNGCNPQEALNEMNNRAGIASDFTGIATKRIQEEHTLSQQKKAAEAFAKREDLEEMNTAIDEIKNTVEQGNDPSIVKQTEYINKKEQNSSDIANKVLKDAVENKADVPLPHGYDSEKQTELSPDEIQTLQDDIEKRGVFKDKSKGEISSAWQRVKNKVSSWFDDNSDKNTSGSDNSGSGFETGNPSDKNTKETQAVISGMTATLR